MHFYFIKFILIFFLYCNTSWANVAEVKCFIHFKNPQTQAWDFVYSGIVFSKENSLNTNKSDKRENYLFVKVYKNQGSAEKSFKFEVSHLSDLKQWSYSKDVLPYNNSIVFRWSFVKNKMTFGSDIIYLDAGYIQIKNSGEILTLNKSEIWDLSKEYFIQNYYQFRRVCKLI